MWRIRRRSGDALAPREHHLERIAHQHELGIDDVIQRQHLGNVTIQVV